MNRLRASESILANANRIQSIELDDLIYLERDLAFDEKVSLMFLLCADNHVLSDYFQQQLFVASHSPHDETTFLHLWASNLHETNAEWRDKLIEALCIIQAKAIIRKLGLNHTDLEQRFLPRNVDTVRLFIHPIIKLLYLLSDQLAVDQANELIAHVAVNPTGLPNCEHCYNGERLEMHLMYWLSNDILSIGDNRNNTDDARCHVPCNLEPIARFLKDIGEDSLKDTVSSVCKRFDSSRSAIPANNKLSVDMNIASCSAQPPPDTDDRYTIRKSKAGICLIIDQQEFHRNVSPSLCFKLPDETLKIRLGTERDKAKLHETFSTYGYKIIEKTNLNHSGVIEEIFKAVKECAEMDSLVVCILSHGHKGAIYGADSIPVEIEEIENTIASTHLVGKPKILIVQACQGVITQRAMNYLQHDGPSKSSSPFSDLLTCVSTVRGFTSLRHIEDGSWFIQTLCQKISELAAHEHFAEILRITGADVMQKRGPGNECMVPINCSTFGKKLYFPLN